MIALVTNQLITSHYTSTNSTMEQRENLLDVLQTLFRWWKTIAYVCLGVGIGAALLSLLLPNYYESTTTFYANSIDQAKPGQIFGTSTREVEFYGDDRDNDRLLTIAESNDLKDYMIEKFGLYKHYDINPTGEKAAYKVRLKFNKHYTVTKTKRDAIELSIEDEDKELAANMVNAVRKKVDELAVEVVSKQLQKIQKNLETNITQKEKQLAVIGDSIRLLRNRYGIYSTESQGEGLASQILDTESQLVRAEAKLNAFKAIPTITKDSLAQIAANVAGYKSQLAVLKERTAAYNEGLSQVLILERSERDMSNKLSTEKVQLNQLKTVLNTQISAINLIEAGAIPIIKSRPKRSVIVISAVLVTFIFSVIGIILFETYKDVDWGAVTK
ncbi:MAG: hypothetical protein AAF960_18415 [Bacteroidota bacterium]